MISIETAQEVHVILIQQFGGSSGIRDTGALESALARPFQKFAEMELYSDPVAKAAALLESIIVNHPFVDGNKRTGYVLARLLLISYNQDVYASEDEKFSFVIAVASGEKTLEEITIWFKQNSREQNIR